MNIFNSDFSKFLKRVFDVLCVNILWVIFSIPLITIGASTCAAFSVTLKLVDDEDVSAVKMFLKSFKQNFKQGTIIWIIVAACGYLLYLLWQGIIKADLSIVIVLACAIVTVIFLFCTFYTFPLIARYENTLKMMIKNSLGISIQFFWRSLFIIAITVVEIAIICCSKWTLFVGIIIGPEVVVYTISVMAKKIFLNIENHKNDDFDDEDTEVDSKEDENSDEIDSEVEE